MNAQLDLRFCLDVDVDIRGSGTNCHFQQLVHLIVRRLLPGHLVALFLARTPGLEHRFRERPFGAISLATHCALYFVVSNLLHRITRLHIVNIVHMGHDGVTVFLMVFQYFEDSRVLT